MRAARIARSSVTFSGRTWLCWWLISWQCSGPRLRRDAHPHAGDVYSPASGGEAMTRRPWLLLSLLLGCLLPAALPGVARAQTVTVTQVKVFAPWGPGLMPQLNPNVTVTARETLEGNPSINGASCQSGAITTSRPDAWRCVTADPCFTPSLIGGDQIFCSTTPWSG